MAESVKQLNNAYTEVARSYIELERIKKDRGLSERQQEAMDILAACIDIMHDCDWLLEGGEHLPSLDPNEGLF